MSELTYKQLIELVDEKELESKLNDNEMDFTGVMSADFDADNVYQFGSHFEISGKSGEIYDVQVITYQDKNDVDEFELEQLDWDEKSWEYFVELQN